MVHLFGEIDVNVSEEPQLFLKRVRKIAEMCGYNVELKNVFREFGSANIEIYGEDSPDIYTIVNYVNIWRNKINSFQKVIYTIKYLDTQTTLRKMHKVYNYNQKTNTWQLNFDADKYRLENNKPELFMEIL